MNPSFIFAVFICMQHRFDFGEDKLMIGREINSGFYLIAIWLGRVMKSCLFGSIKVMVYALVRYIFAAPLELFISYIVAWILLGLWWVAFAQLVSLLFKDQVTAVIILLMVPIFE